jgi:hypothetical protein
MILANQGEELLFSRGMAVIETFAGALILLCDPQAHPNHHLKGEVWCKAPILENKRFSEENVPNDENPVKSTSLDWRICKHWEDKRIIRKERSVG